MDSLSLEKSFHSNLFALYLEMFSLLLLLLLLLFYKFLIALFYKFLLLCQVLLNASAS